MTAKQFINDDFLLDTEAARVLYHEYAEGLPIIDYHCHLPPAEIAGDIRWENISQAWLCADHYKWRAMRSNGVEERYCTGNATDREKFQKFAETMPYLLRNPMYHWSHLELARYFGISDMVLSPETSDAIWERTRAKLAEPGMSARGLVAQSNVEVICTTDDPIDDLRYHAQIAADKGVRAKVLPAWRPDKGMAIEKTEAWNRWVDALGEAADVEIATLDDFWRAIERRHKHFEESGCVLSDYGFGELPCIPCEMDDAAKIFAAARAGRAISRDDATRFRFAAIIRFGELDAGANWTWQLHFGALRNNNIRLFPTLGPDTGFDSIGDWPVATALSGILGRLDAKDALPRTILYTLNPRDNEVLGAMLGNFQRGPTPCKMQLGSGWWFNDQMDGMKRQLEALSQLSLVGRFVGMLTDSRSFLSYTRHEYFRRIVCSVFGADIEKGLIPRDYKWVGKLIRGISHDNAAGYFQFDR